MDRQVAELRTLLLQHQQQQELGSIETSWKHEDVKVGLEMERLTTLKLEASGKVIVEASWQRDSRGRVWIWGLHVDPDVRRRGVGSAVFHTLQVDCG
jgi:predicted GNAT family acetyltransferase